MSVTVTLAPEAVQAIAMVGTKVSPQYRPDQTYTVHSVEGPTWYAFQNDHGDVSIDTSMTLASWLAVPVAMILPEGSKIGEGFGVEVPISSLVRADGSKCDL